MCRFILLMYRKKSPQGRTNTLQNFICFEADEQVWFPRFWFHKFELYQYAIQGAKLSLLWNNYFLVIYMKLRLKMDWKCFALEIP
eukprot:UN01831